MKNLLFTSVILTFITAFSFAQIEKNIAKEVLKAYKERNTELLKKNASGIMKYAITDSYFKSEKNQEIINAVDKWDGKIKEIRYKSGDMMGKKIFLCSVYFADSQENKDEIYTVVLSSYDNKKWLMFAGGIIEEKKEEFEKMNLGNGENENVVEKDENVKKDAPKNFSIEMANGKTFDEISETTISESINSLNNDNFFLILNSDIGFLQAAYSDKGNTVQYKENEKQFEAEKLFSKEETIQIFKNYFQGKSNWKEGVKWVIYE